MCCSDAQSQVEDQFKSCIESTVRVSSATFGIQDDPEGIAPLINIKSVRNFKEHPVTCRAASTRIILG